MVIRVQCSVFYIILLVLLIDLWIMDESLNDEELKREEKETPVFPSPINTFSGLFSLFLRSWDFYKKHFSILLTVMLIPVATTALFLLFSPQITQGVRPSFLWCRDTCLSADRVLV